MKKLISVLLLLCCLLALGVCLWMRADADRAQTAPVQGEPAAAEQMPAGAAPENAAEPAEPAAETAVPDAAVPAAEAAGPAGEAVIIPEESEPDYLSAYAPVFDSYRRLLAGEEPETGGITERGDYYLELGETGVSYLCSYVQTLGYALLDMDGNGVPELLIGSGEEGQDRTIFDMFTLVDGAPQRVLISSERVTYMLCRDNQILHSGSGGAAYSFTVLLRYSGTDLTVTGGVVMAGEEQYYEIAGAAGDIFMERLPGDTPITGEEYFAKADAMESDEIPLPLQPLQ